MSNKMLMSKVADPYASALLNLASSTNTLDTITSDINDLLELFDSNENLVGYLRNPMYSKSSKKEVLEKVIAPLYFNENTVRFLMVLLDRSRIDLLESIAEKYLQMVYDFAEIKIAQVSSAIPLTPDQELDLMAPGGFITSASGNGQYYVTQGTSMASPYVAGGIALIQQIAEEELNRKLSVEEVENLISNNSSIKSIGSL